ncbi:patatin-like phospholipase family protein [Clostridium boliviensis]|uniref:Patatin-like phospholipase family protein n=1 Tax=Clostridium boliviensis TaxID=318465 RepID=A0ABU4GQP8_9CLOT|nr:patatin-like phospholipase family protein [Clostridium boliviensis]MDW2799961.1 patatin-like phospholipase family protein [Clostridium boliviensis]
MADYGLALSGGGTKGAIHVGVLTALEENGLLPDRIAGASAGSIVAGLYASGMDIGALRENVRWLAKHGDHYIDPNILGVLLFLPQVLLHRSPSLMGLIKGNRLLHYLCDLTDGLEIQDCQKGLLIPTVDLNSGNTVVFTNLFEEKAPISALREENVKWQKNGLLCDIMMASSSVPAVFSPRQINGYMLVDGGVTNNLPVDLFISTGESRVMAVDIGDTYEMPKDHSIMEIAFHSFSIMSRELKDCRSSGEIFLLKPPIPKGAGLLTFEYMEECMESGYVYTKKMMPRIRRALEKTI